MTAPNATNMYVAKRAIFARLVQLAAGGGPLATLGVDGGPLQVKYDNRMRGMEDRCIYGGGARFEQPDDQRISDGYRELAQEEAVSVWFVRVSGPVDTDIADLDEEAEEILAAVAQVIATEPDIAGGHSRSYLGSGQGDYVADDEENVSLISCEIHTQSQIEGA